MGSIQFPKLSNLCKQIWQWCEKRRLWIFASYIASCENSLADKESRRLPSETKWELAPLAFQKLEHTFGCFEIDLFASSANKKCKKFISLKQDPNSYAIDSFTVIWTKYKFYAFPQFSVILRTLQKIITDRAEGLLVVPYWPTQSWFPLFQSLLLNNPVIFEPSNDLLICPFRKKHSLAEKLTLVAKVLSGKRI